MMQMGEVEAEERRLQVQQLKQQVWCIHMSPQALKYLYIPLTEALRINFPRELPRKWPFPRKLSRKFLRKSPYPGKLPRKIASWGFPTPSLEEFNICYAISIFSFSSDWRRFILSLNLLCFELTKHLSVDYPLEAVHKVHHLNKESARHCTPS